MCEYKSEGHIAIKSTCILIFKNQLFKNGLASINVRIWRFIGRVIRN